MSEGKKDKRLETPVTYSLCSNEGKPRKACIRSVVLPHHILMYVEINSEYLLYGNM